MEICWMQCSVVDKISPGPGHLKTSVQYHILHIFEESSSFSVLMEKLAFKRHFCLTIALRIKYIVRGWVVMANIIFFSVNILREMILTRLWHVTEPPGEIPHASVASIRCSAFAAAPLGKNYHSRCKDGRLRKVDWPDWGWRSKPCSKLTFGLGPAPFDKAACRATEPSVPWPKVGLVAPSRAAGCRGAGDSVGDISVCLSGTAPAASWAACLVFPPK